jgi:hypothetical protein
MGWRTSCDMQKKQIRGLFFEKRNQNKKQSLIWNSPEMKYP